MDAKITETRRLIAEAGQMMFERYLTDTAGGNISARIGDLVCITPRYAGYTNHWRIRPEQVLVTDLQGNKIEGEGEVSREAETHFKLLNEFPDGSAVVHAHARNILALSTILQKPMLPVIEATLKFGIVELTDYAPAHSGQLAENVACKLHGREANIRKQAAAVIARYHGMFVIGKDLNAAVDAVERLNINAQIILSSQAMSYDISQNMALMNARLREAVEEFGKSGY